MTDKESKDANRVSIYNQPAVHVFDMKGPPHLLGMNAHRFQSEKTDWMCISLGCLGLLLVSDATSGTIMQGLNSSSGCLGIGAPLLGAQRKSDAMIELHISKVTIPSWSVFAETHQGLANSMLSVADSPWKDGFGLWDYSFSFDEILDPWQIATYHPARFLLISSLKMSSLRASQIPSDLYLKKETVP